MMILWELCITFMTIGISAFGGGYAVMPLFQTYLVQQRGWLTLVELADITAISQMTPGPIILNCPTFVGIKMAGILGGIIATVSAVLPSFVLMLILGYFFFKHSNLEFIQAILKGLRPAIVGLILIATLALIKTSLFDGMWPTSLSASLNLPAIFAFGVGLMISSKTKLDTFAIVVIGGIIGILSYFIL